MRDVGGFARSYDFMFDTGLNSLVDVACPREGWLVIMSGLGCDVIICCHFSLVWPQVKVTSHYRCGPLKYQHSIPTDTENPKPQGREGGGGSGSGWVTIIECNDENVKFKF